MEKGRLGGRRAHSAWRLGAAAAGQLRFRGSEPRSQGRPGDDGPFPAGRSWPARVHPGLSWTLSQERPGAAITLDGRVRKCWGCLGLQGSIPDLVAWERGAAEGYDTSLLCECEACRLMPPWGLCEPESNGRSGRLGQLSSAGKPWARTRPYCPPPHRTPPLFQALLAPTRGGAGARTLRHQASPAPGCHIPRVRANTQTNRRAVGLRVISSSGRGCQRESAEVWGE